MRKDSRKIRVAITGVGNCVPALVQGISFYKDVVSDESVPGLIDAVRCALPALDRGTGRALTGPSRYFMKSPPRQFTDIEARIRTEAFIRNEESDAEADAGPVVQDPAMARGGKITEKTSAVRPSTVPV